MGNLTHFASSSGPLNGDVHDSPGDAPDDPAVGGSADGYASEDFVAGSSSSRERKKGLIFFFIFEKFSFWVLGIVCVFFFFLRR